ncbi:DUF4974 domain-containing protein [Spirosoma taeanense]|uniref:DUF4974 domain-containing protein n=1 Tax=Spirosoma taeanense TaxID=2735870 RepID=A0A6M5Y7W7_9BACT|nr:FecR family protein [Spirosoma taeanense]QJW89999.1 DUF4974 domain-containing protein [Spirosoma taeanense]
MQDNRHFEPEDLATDPSFQRWQLHDDPVEASIWQEWLVQNPDRKESIEKASVLLNSIRVGYAEEPEGNRTVSDREVQEEIHRLYQSIDAPRVLSVKWFQRTPVRYGMAASVLVILGLFGWYLLHPFRAQTEVTYGELVAQAHNPLKEVINTSASPLVVNLPDKSTILLYPRSRVSYSSHFSGVRREVYLLGEAFFEVSKNPLKPFYVYADGLVTKVLGTSFLVQTNERAGQVKVIVKTGKVSVFARNQMPSPEQKEDYKLGGTVLTPNQQVVFSAEETRLVKSVVQDPALLKKSIQKESFNFKRTPITNVFATLEQAYSIKIIYDEELMKNCYLTATLYDEPLFEKLDLICRTINADYEQLDGYIVINSPGCN